MRGMKNLLTIVSSEVQILLGTQNKSDKLSVGQVEYPSGLFAKALTLAEGGSTGSILAKSTNKKRLLMQQPPAS